jgi:iron complex outermembrane recepter protein
MEKVFNRMKALTPIRRILLRRAVVRALAALMVLCLIASVAAASYGAIEMPMDLTLLSIEDLMAIEFTTLSRKTRRLTDTSAAVFVITEEDIRRSGALNIPDTLRMVPGLQVARISADKWAISSRGFNAWFSNKLLVLMDGRTVYNTIYSGVYWHKQDVLMEDVARIEVIRGPGASLWGANAVNGIINIVTKTASEAQGGLFMAGAGTEERAFGALRYGGRIGESAHFSAYVKHAEHDSVVDSAGNDAGDEWRLSKAAGRIDWEVSGRDNLTIMGDFYRGRTDSSIYYVTETPPWYARYESRDRLEGYNLLGRWQRTYSASSDMTLQAYFNRNENSFSTYSEEVSTFDLDLQHRFALGNRQEILWGTGYRANRGHIENSPLMEFDPKTRTDHLFSFFLQDEITLLPRRLAMIIGSKFEENSYTGWEIQPNARLLMTPHYGHTLWAAVSRAVRTPSRFDHDVRVTSAIAEYPGAYYEVLGSKDFKSEEVIAYEAGYRFFSRPSFALDLALFYNRYDHLRTWEIGIPYMEGGPPIYVPLVTVNGMQGDSYGAELALDWKPTNAWRLKGAYSYLIMDLKDEATFNTVAKATEGSSPVHQLSVQSAVDLPFGMQWDTWIRYIDRLPSEFQKISSYWTLDMRLGWRATKSLEVSIVGQNLLDSRHAEFVSEIEGLIPAKIERNVYAKLLWRF